MKKKTIVSNIYGIIRDVIEKVIKGIPFRFINTTDFRNTTDEIEKLDYNKKKSSYL